MSSYCLVTIRSGVCDVVVCHHA